MWPRRNVLLSMKSLRLVSLAALLALLSSPVIAADPPDMTGVWLVDIAKSDFGPMPAPSDLRLDIRTEAGEFYVKQSGGGQPEVELHFNTSGKEVTNELPGARMTSTHRWEDAVLVGELKIVTDDTTTLTFKDRTTYSPDGKVMTSDRTLSGPMGEVKMKLVLNKK
jgi:hypothetical protein